ncbi:MAG TPA: hypothetical protein VJ327_03330 [Patescibacteria group bacterium]|nr:hypothetical protein [Patescibacteria group bacterium]
MNTVHAIATGALVALGLNAVGWFWKNRKGHLPHQKKSKYIVLEKQILFKTSALSDDEAQKISEDILNQDHAESIPLKKLRELFEAQDPLDPLVIKWNDGTEEIFSGDRWKKADPLDM